MRSSSTALARCAIRSTTCRNTRSSPSEEKDLKSRTIELQLHGFGAPPTSARAEVAELAPAERLKRAALVFGAFVAVAVVALPIPIVHFVLVPGGLLLAVTLGALRLREGQIFRGVEGRCPFCGTEQQFSIFGRYRLPRKVDCVSCHRRLVLQRTEKTERTERTERGR